MNLQFFFLVTTISIITILSMVEVSTAKPDFLFDKKKDFPEDRFDEREDLREHLDSIEPREDRFDEKEDLREHLDSIEPRDRDFMDFPPEQIPLLKELP